MNDYALATVFIGFGSAWAYDGIMGNHGVSWGPRRDPGGYIGKWGLYGR